MDTWTIDFETFYSREYSLSRMTTEEYVRDPRFEAILCGFKLNNEPAFWVPGDHIQETLDFIQIDQCAVVAHHAQFDGLILSHHYGHTPKLWVDTLSLARAHLGIKTPLSLAALAKRFELGVKGTEVQTFMGYRRQDFSPYALATYGQYCCNDVDLEYALASILMSYFRKTEVQIQDMVIRMFTEPKVQLMGDVLADYIQEIQEQKQHALEVAGITLAEVMSNQKFAEALIRLGVDPPTKVSPTTGKEAYAFAKTDAGMEELLDHPLLEVQALAAARVKNKSTIAESRATRMLAMAERGACPIYLKYSGAEQTHRLCLSGDTVITVLREGAVLDILLRDLQDLDLVWEGEVFVSHGGLLDQGLREVITYAGLTGTPDHRIYVEELDGEIALSEAAQRGYAPKVANRPQHVTPYPSKLAGNDDGESGSSV